jgi:hypothetical protein
MTLQELINETVSESRKGELLLPETYLPGQDDIDKIVSLAPTSYIAVASVEANELAMQQLKDAKGVIKKIDEECDAIKKPLNEAKTKLIGFFDRIKEPINNFIAVQSQQCLEFQKAENKRLEDARKAAIAKAAEEERKRQEEIASLTPFDEVPAPKSDISEVLALPTKVVTATGGGLRKKPIDIKVLDVEKGVAKMASDVRFHGFLTLDTKALKAHAQQIGVEKFNEKFGESVKAFQDETLSNR